LIYPAASDWFKSTDNSAGKLDSEVISWLVDLASLTSELREYCPALFYVRGRRPLFNIDDNPSLVNEFFLPVLFGKI